MQTQGGLHPVACAGLFKQRFRTSIGSSASSNCSYPGDHAPHLSPRSLCPVCASAPSMIFQERLSAAADSMTVMSSCRPILINLASSQLVHLERANSNPSTNITCMAPVTCRPPLVVLSTVRPSSHLCQNLVSHGSQCAAQIAASCEHAVLAASKHVDRTALP